MCCQSELFVRSSSAFTAPGNLPLEPHRADHLVPGETMEHLCAREERGRRVRWGQGGGTQDLCWGGRDCKAPLCLQAGLHALPSHQGTGVGWDGWGEVGVCLQSLLAHSHTLMGLPFTPCKTVFLSFPAFPTGSSCIIVIHHVSCQLL